MPATLMVAAFEQPPDARTGAAVVPAAGHSDLALAQAVLQRDRKATAVFVERFSDPVYRYAASRLAPRAELADDIVQDVFLTAWGRLASYTGSSSLEGWLLGIARHKIEDHYRQRLRRWEAWEDVEHEVPSDTAAALEIEIDRERIAGRSAEILNSLPEQYSTVLLWRYWEKRSAREIAASTGKTEKAVERLLARARERFKRRWLDV